MTKMTQQEIKQLEKEPKACSIGENLFNLTCCIFPESDIEKYGYNIWYKSNIDLLRNVISDRHLAVLDSDYNYSKL